MRPVTRRGSSDSCGAARRFVDRSRSERALDCLTASRIERSKRCCIRLFMSHQRFWLRLRPWSLTQPPGSAAAWRSAGRSAAKRKAFRIRPDVAIVSAVPAGNRRNEHSRSRRGANEKRKIALLTEYSEIVGSCIPAASVQAAPPAWRSYQCINGMLGGMSAGQLGGSAA
jgi:hypothetical protein